MVNYQLLIMLIDKGDDKSDTCMSTYNCISLDY